MPARGMRYQIYAAVGLAVALLAIVGVVVGAVLGTAKKDAPPALDAVGFKPEDWQNVLNLSGNLRATAACQLPRRTPDLDRCATQRSAPFVPSGPGSHICTGTQPRLRRT